MAAGRVGIHKSRVARRIFLLFLACGLGPMAGLAMLLLERTSAELERLAGHRLQQACKTTALTLYQRLIRFGEEVKAAACAAPAAAPASRQLELSLVPGGTEAAAGLGRELGSEDRRHLAQAEVVLLPPAAGDPTRSLRMVAAKRSGRAHEEYVVGRIHSSALWGEEGFLVPRTDLIVLEQAGGILSSTCPSQEPLAELRSRLAEEPSGGRLQWRRDGEEQFAVYWTLFMVPRFRASWILVYSQPRAEVLGALASFGRIALFASLLAVALAALLSLSQIRRSLVPITGLQAATRRIAAGDLSARVQVATRDEFAELGASFNEMAARLEANLAQRRRTEAELVQARDEAVAAARTESEFVTNVSHELRTPLTSIRSYAEILRDYADVDHANREEFLGIIIEESDRVTRLITDILDLSKIQSGRQVWRMRPGRIEETLKAALRAVAASAREKGILLEEEPFPALPELEIDRDRLQQVWINLLANAIKFTPIGGRVAIRIKPAGEGLVAVEVQDEGCGIHPAHHRQIFERFRQVSPDLLTDKPAGTGLGLTIAKGIVEQHQGRIEVESEPGMGALFRVILPLPAPMVPAPDRAAAAVPALAAP